MKDKERKEYDKKIEGIKVEDGLCGHVNKHSLGIDKKLDFIVCDLPADHGGDHSGVHQEYRKEYDVQIVNGIETTRVLLVADEFRCAWGNMAGTYVDDIPRPADVKPLTLMEMEKRVLELERGK